MGLLVPDYIFKDVTKITPAFLQQHGLRGLALDVDNTLTEHGSQRLRPEISAWLKTMRQNNIQLMVVSNNVKKRVAPFAGAIGLDYISFSCKPMPRGLWLARQKWNLPKNQIALVGDQIYTDALAAGLYGITMLLVQPMAQDTKATIRLKRSLEKPVLRAYYKRGGKLL